MTEIQRADPGRRRGVLLTATVCIVVGAILGAAFLQYQQEFSAWLADTPPKSAERFALVLGAIALLTSLPLLGMALYFWMLGSRVVRARRYPPPGTPVVRDTPVLLERGAILRGRLLQACATVFVAAASGMLGALWWLWSLLPGQGS